MASPIGRPTPGHTLAGLRTQVSGDLTAMISMGTTLVSVWKNYWLLIQVSRARFSALLPILLIHYEKHNTSCQVTKQRRHKTCRAMEMVLGQRDASRKLLAPANLYRSPLFTQQATN